MGKLYMACEWIMRLAYVNLLWIIFSFAGLVFFGVMPATIALFTIVRKWLMKEQEIPIWSTFLTVYRKEFLKGNLIGLLIVVSGAFLVFDFLVLRTVSDAFQIALFVPLLMITAIYIITLLYIFPVYVHYDLNGIRYVKNAFFLGILNIHVTILMVISLSAILFLIFYLPSLIPFFSAVSLAFVLMAGGFYSINRIEARNKDLIWRGG